MFYQMYKRIIIIPKDDLVLYPPTISLINVLLKQGKEIVCLGEYSDEERKTALEHAGVRFIPIYRSIKDVSNNRVVNWVAIYLRMRQYKSKIKQFFETEDITNEDLIWFIYSNTIGYIQKYIEKGDYVVQFYEFEDYSLKGKERLLHPNYDVNRFLSNAKALIHCEYNRAMITNGLYGINKEAVILPNKPYEIGNTEEKTIPEDIERIIDGIKKKVKGRKVILYQGIFNAYERRLDNFCEAISLLPDDYMFVAMGGPGKYFEEMSSRYASEKILFIPFIRPPYHLLITQMAHVGVLTYFPAGKDYVNVLNPLYCAPNKIFEFGQYGIPMISNDVPGLKLIFETYHCGRIVTLPQSPDKIAEAVLSMEKNYEEMSKGSRAYYDSVDVEEIVINILNN